MGLTAALEDDTDINSLKNLIISEAQESVAEFKFENLNEDEDEEI